MLTLFAQLLSTNMGFLFFDNIIINDYLIKILNLWKNYLDSKDSRYVLNKKGTRNRIFSIWWFNKFNFIRKKYSNCLKFYNKEDNSDLIL